MAALKVHLGLVPTTKGSVAHTPSVELRSEASAMELTMMVEAWAGLAARSAPREAATNTARTKKASVLALPSHSAFGGAFLISISSLLLNVEEGREPTSPRRVHW